MVNAILSTRHERGQPAAAAVSAPPAAVRRARLGIWVPPTLVLVAAIGVSGLSGCREPSPAVVPAPLPALSALGTEPGRAVVAQGQLKPAGGILPITAPPGDRIESIAVNVGDTVKAGEALGRLMSQQADELELAVAQTRLREGQQKLAAEQAVARARLEIAKVQLERAELEVQQATEQLQQAESEGGRFDLLQQGVRIAQNKLQQLRDASTDPTARRLVSDSALEAQQLEVDQSIADLEGARREAQAGIEAGRLAVESAMREIQAAELAVDAAGASAALESLQKQLELLELRVESVQLKSPIDGKILAIDVRAGEPTSVAPVMRLADTSNIVCRAEVNVAELPRVAVGALATMTSPAFEQPLRGEVREISPMIGSPTLPSPNPMSRIDWHSVEVTIRIRDEDAERAAQLINLQVDVAIEAASADDRRVPR